LKSSHEVDQLELVVAETISVVAVGIQRRVDAHGSDCGEELHGEAMLHQRFSTAEGEAVRRHVRAETVPAELFGRFRDGDRDSIAQRAGGERDSNVRLRNGATEVDPQLEGA
jgi:hypothetical protein